MIGIVTKSSRAIIWAALLVWMAGGCVRSIQPILEDGQVITDDRLMGSWIGSDGQTFGEVTATDDHKGYKLKFIDKDGKEADFLVRLGKIGEMIIADCTPSDPIPAASDVYKMQLLPLHSFFIVKQVTPRLVLKTMDPGWLSKYVEAHPDELAAVKADKENTIISAATDDIQAFLLEHANDQGAFSDDVTYVRPGDPTTRPAVTQK
jgi:hypothetical protein